MNITLDGLAWLPVSEMAEAQASWLRRKLTIAEAPGRQASLVRCYVENQEAGLLGVPRGFFHGGITRNHTVKEEVSFGDTWPDRRDDSGQPWAESRGDDEKELTFVGSLGEESRRGLQAALKHFGGKDVAEGMLCFPMEREAREVCLSLVRLLRLRTLVLVHDRVSEEAWTSAIRDHLPDAYVGLSPSNHIGVVTVDGMRELRRLGGHYSDSFGMLIAADLGIVDVPAWSSLLASIPAAKRVGLAPLGGFTGARRLIDYHLGQRIFAAKKDQLIPKIRRVWSEWKLGGSSRGNPLFISSDVVIDAMATSAIYNQHVVEQIVLACKAGRKIVVFSEHLSHLKVLRKEVESKWVGELAVDYLVEGMGRLDIADALEARVILTLYSMSRALPEMPSVDTVVLATPVKDPSDAVSCALAPDPEKKDPVVVDMRCDGIPVCKEYGAARDSLYQRLYGEERT